MKFISDTTRLAALLAIGVSIAVTSQAQSFLTKGLVLYLPFNGSVNDASGNGNDASAHGMFSYGTDSITGRNFIQTTGDHSLAINPYVNGGYVLFPNLTGIVTNSITVSFWVKLLDPLPLDYPMSFGMDNEYQLCMGIDCYNGFFIQDNSGSAIAYVPITTTNISGIWKHFVFAYQPGNLTAFIDGQFVGQTNKTVTGLALAPGALGWHQWLTGTAANSSWQFANARIYNRALSSNEVTQLYAIESVPPIFPLSITSQPASVTNNLGDNVALFIGVTGGQPGYPMGFQWYFAGTNIDNGNNSALIISNIQQSYFGNYFVVVTNAFSSVTSSVATIYEPATIIAQPTNVVVPFQTPATFSVTAVGYPAPSYYQWTLNGTNINGANATSLTIPSVKLQDTGNYQVLVSNTISATNSSVVTLDMSPSITSPFIGATPIWGRNATLSIGAIGNGTLSYQWYFNGQLISGAVLPQLDFSAIQLTNSGFYSVVISSPYGSVTNAAYQVQVSPAVVTLGFYPGLTINGAKGDNYIIQRSANLSNSTNWQTVSSLTLYQDVELWIDTSIDATSPFNNIYFYQLIPQ